MTAINPSPPSLQPPAFTGPVPRHIGAVNWRGLWTLTVREVRRFLKVYIQTLLAPVVTALLFLAVFSLSVGRAGVTVHGVPFTAFLAPGLAMMAITQNAFANSSSSLGVMKMQGNIVNLLMSPLSSFELVVGFAVGGLVRGLMVGAAVLLAVSPFAPVAMVNPGLALYFAVGGALFMSLLGIPAALWAEKFDHMAVVTNFVIMPLAFLSGTFYSIERLPDVLRMAAFLDPLFYLIDGFRAGFVGLSDAPVALGMTVVAVADILMAGLAYMLVRNGYKLRA